MHPTKKNPQNNLIKVIIKHNKISLNVHAFVLQYVNNEYPSDEIIFNFL